MIGPDVIGVKVGFQRIAEDRQGFSVIKQIIRQLGGGE
jgi:hypothetical protein